MDESPQHLRRLLANRVELAVGLEDANGSLSETSLNSVGMILKDPRAVSAASKDVENLIAESPQLKTPITLYRNYKISDRPDGFIHGLGQENGFLIGSSSKLSGDCVQITVPQGVPVLKLPNGVHILGRNYALCFVSIDGRMFALAEPPRPMTASAAVEELFNKYHDPRDGRFRAKGGSGSSSRHAAEKEVKAPVSSARTKTVLKIAGIAVAAVAVVALVAVGVRVQGNRNVARRLHDDSVKKERRALEVDKIKPKYHQRMADLDAKHKSAMREAAKRFGVPLDESTRYPDMHHPNYTKTFNSEISAISDATQKGFNAIHADFKKEAGPGFLL